MQVAVKPAFDPSLLRLRDEMEEGKRRMEGLAKEAGKKVYGQVKDADKKVKLDWRWVGGWMSEGGLRWMTTRQLAYTRPHHTHSAVHQHHFRVTKKDQPALKKIAASLEVQVKAGGKVGGDGRRYF